MADAFGSNTVQTVQKIPLLTTSAGPRDNEGWEGRLKQVRIKHGRLQVPRELDRIPVNEIGACICRHPFALRFSRMDCTHARMHAHTVVVVS